MNEVTWNENDNALKIRFKVETVCARNLNCLKVHDQTLK